MFSRSIEWFEEAWMLAGEEENATISQAQVNYQENSQQNYKIHNNRIRENAQPNSKRYKPRWTRISITKQIYNRTPKDTAKFENEFENTIQFLFKVKQFLDHAAKEHDERVLKVVWASFVVFFFFFLIERSSSQAINKSFFIYSFY